MSFEKPKLVTESHQSHWQSTRKNNPRIIFHYAFQSKNITCIDTVNVTNSLGSWIGVKGIIKCHSKDINKPEKHHETQEPIVPLKSYTNTEIICFFIIDNIMQERIRNNSTTKNFKHHPFKNTRIKNIVQICVDSLFLHPSYVKNFTCNDIDDYKQIK